MGSIGARLRTIRRQWQLSLREVEKRSLRLAREKGNQSYQVSASWLNRLECGEHELSVSKLMTLAEIYNVSTGQLLRCIDPGSGQNLIPRQLSPENASMLPGEGSLEAQADICSRIRLFPLSRPTTRPSTRCRVRSVTGAIQVGNHWKTRPDPAPHDRCWFYRSDRYAKAGNLNSKKLDPRIRATHLFPQDSGRLCLRLVRVG